MDEKLIKFKSFDGTDLNGKITKANNEKGALLFVHGITSSKDELNFHSEFANYLSKNGITSFRFDYRFHGGEHEGGLELKELTLCGIINDIDAAFTILKKEVSLSTQNFYIVGTSFGGGLSAFWVDINNKLEIKKVILNAPVINYEDDVLIRNELIVDNMLSENAQKQIKKQKCIVSSDIIFGQSLINELKYINGIKPLKRLGKKVVIFHGEDDDDVPIDSSIKYKANETKLIKVPNVGHGFGVEDDEDLDFPETKIIHQNIYKQTLGIINSTL